MPKTLAEIEDTIREFAYLLFLANAGCSRKQLADFHAHGIPEEWARQFAREIPKLPVEDWPRVIPSPMSLQHDTTKRIIRTMDVNTDKQPTSVKLGAARARRKSAAQRKLYEKGQTISGLAKLLDEGRPRVSAWFATGEDQRPVPMRHKAALKKYGITEDDGIRFAD